MQRHPGLEFCCQYCYHICYPITSAPKLTGALLFWGDLCGGIGCRPSRGSLQKPAVLWMRFTTVLSRWLIWVVNEKAKQRLAIQHRSSQKEVRCANEISEWWHDQGHSKGGLTALHKQDERLFYIKCWKFRIEAIVNATKGSIKRPVWVS